jgi:cytochrome c-type biogenesis protein CcmE
MSDTGTLEPEAVPVIRRRKSNKRYLIAGGLCVAAVIALLVGGLSRNIVYFKTVNEAVQERDDGGGDGRLRMMGAVVSGSVQRTETGVTFKMTAGGKTANVLHRGDPPELFKDGAPVVCEGRWDGKTFDSDRIMIKHGSEYRPPPADKAG